MTSFVYSLRFPALAVICIGSLAVQGWVFQLGWKAGTGEPPKYRWLRSITGFLICVLFLANPFARKNRCMWLPDRRKVAR